MEIIANYYLQLICENEPAGTRTRDPVIKSHMLYQLSYRLVAVLEYAGHSSRQEKPRQCPLSEARMLQKPPAGTPEVTPPAAYEVSDGYFSPFPTQVVSP